MNEQEIKATLEKQLQLLSERSNHPDVSVEGLVALTRAMSEIAGYLLLRSSGVL